MGPGLANCVITAPGLDRPLVYTGPWFRPAPGLANSVIGFLNKLLFLGSESSERKTNAGEK